MTLCRERTDSTILFVFFFFDLPFPVLLSNKSAIEAEERALTLESLLSFIDDWAML